MFDLLTTLKLLCMRLWQNMVSGVDDLRLEVALKMLKSPHFNAKMNSLKEVCHSMQTYFVFFFFLQSSQVKHTPQDAINKFIIRKLNPSVVVDLRFISAFLHA